MHYTTFLIHVKDSFPAPCYQEELEKSYRGN